jgi:acetyl-CoA synthetase
MSTAEIESAIVSYPRVAEAAVIGQSRRGHGPVRRPRFVTLEGDATGDDALVADIREHVAKRIGKLARPKRIIWADDLPEDALGQDHAPAAARHRRGPRARRRDDAARPRT